VATATGKRKYKYMAVQRYPPAVAKRAKRAPGDGVADEVWRPVPGLAFGEDELLVSSEGRVRNKGSRVALGPPHRGSRHPSGYYSINLLRKPRKVHDLVCRTFGGERPTPQHTADHKNHDKGDNRACNLRWASKSEQVLNRRKARPRSDCKPVLARRAGSTDAWIEYSSVLAAAKAHGVKPAHVSRVADGKGTHTGGYVFKWGAPREPQADLPAEGTKPAERWKDASDRLNISNRGRVQTKHARGTKWGPRRTPLPNRGAQYASVMHQSRDHGKDHLVHVLVWQLFGARALKPGETIDHRDRETTNNSIDNLRPATKREQSLNQTRQHKSQIQQSLKAPVRGKPADGSCEWETFESQGEAARTLIARFPSKKFKCGTINRVVHGGRKSHHGWVFEHA